MNHSASEPIDRNSVVWIDSKTNTRGIILSDCKVITSAGNEECLLAGLQGSPTDTLQSDEFLLSGRTGYFGKVDSTLLNTDPSKPCSATCRILQHLISQMEDTISRLSQSYRSDRIGVVIGTTTTGIREVESEKSLEKVNYHQHQELAAVSENIADYCGFSGPNLVVSTACTSGAKSLAMARDLIRSGWCDAVIAGAGESLNRLTCQGFDSLESYAEGVSKPFQKNRDGINIGEGGALFSVEKGDVGIALAGFAESSDAWHETAPDPDGVFASAAIRSALNDAGLDADDIGYINLHGTGTRLNDTMESKVVSEIFGDRVASSSTKPVTGHVLGAAGAVEAAILWLLLNENKPVVLPPQYGVERYDPALPKIKLVDSSNNQPQKLTAAMSTSFAFGGHNTALILSKREAA